MQNQTQTVSAVAPPMPAAKPEGEVVVLERAFKQRQATTRLGIDQLLPSDVICELSKFAFIHKELPAGAIESLAALCADLADAYARAAKMCEAHASTYVLCLAAHKHSALLSDARHRLRDISTSADGPHEKRRLLSPIFAAVLGASESEHAPSALFKKCLNDDSLPVALRVGIAVLFARIKLILRQAGAIRRAVNEI